MVAGRAWLGAVLAGSLSFSVALSLHDDLVSVVGESVDGKKRLRKGDAALLLACRDVHEFVLPVCAVSQLRLFENVRLDTRLALVDCSEACERILARRQTPGYPKQHDLGSKR